MSVHPLRLLALLLLAASVAIGSYQIMKPQTVAYIQLRASMDKESGQLLRAEDMEPLVLTMANSFLGVTPPIPGLIPWEQMSKYVGLPLARPVKGGRPLLESDLEKAGQPQTNAKIDASTTGMSIPVDNIAGVSPYVSTGERVHVYASFEDDSGAHSGLLLQNMPVIGVQRETEGDEPRLTAVTLSLSRNEAVLLTHALHYGKIRLGLAPILEGQKAGIGDARFAAELVKTKKRWGNREEERD